MYKIDFHTHSIMSPDGSITEKEYEDCLASQRLDYIAITDHNRIDFAQKMQKKFGDKIIIGEEVMTQDGEVIGLFLTKKIVAGLPLQETMDAIHKQDGIVYIPHPFDRLRHGIGEMRLLKYIEQIDIVEGFNGRIIFRSQNKKAETFALSHKKIVGIGSDAHVQEGLGYTYAMIEKPFTRSTALENLSHAQLQKKYQPWWAYLAPKWNRLLKHL